MSDIQPSLVRPKSLLVATGLLAFNSVLLLIWWILFPGEVQSNGAQVFFIMLWFAAAWGLLIGESWVRVGIVLVLAAYVWGLINHTSVTEALANINFGDQSSKLIALIAVVLLYVPASRQWFAQKNAKT